MIRAAACGSLLFLVAGLFWIAYDPLLAWSEVGVLDAPGADLVRTESALLRRGRGSVWALRQALDAPSETTRMRGARLLALLRDDASDQVLLRELRRGGAAPRVQLAEHLLLTVWDRRNGPAPDVVARALRPVGEDLAAEASAWAELNEQLKLYPAWAGGYLARARLQLRKNRLTGVLEDALRALHWEPEHFEALALAGRCYLALDCPAAARERLERALEIHPGLQPRLKDDLEAARKQSAAEREQRAIERRRALPVG